MAKIYKGSAPCKGCERRNADCHSVCEDYIKWKESGVEIKKEPIPTCTNFANVNRHIGSNGYRKGKRKWTQKKIEK